MDEIITKTIENLKNHNIDAFYVENKEDAVKKVLELIPSNTKIGFGGSMTLKDLNIFNHLREKGCEILDWTDPTKSIEENVKTRKMNFFADYYLSSSNAVTMEGELVNIDGRGNRVAAMTYGPEKVIVIIGKNKIVKDREAAFERIRKTAAPLNAKRLNKKTPCTAKGECQDCNSPDRICRTTVIHNNQYTNRMSVIIINEDLGY